MTYDSTESTQAHIDRVRDLIRGFCAIMLHRGEVHDASKLGEFEKPYFDEVTPRLKDLVFGSPEYLESVKLLKSALDHHYANNSHHPQHYENGINGMDLFDIVEMILDWKASGERNDRGNIFSSIEINAERFGISKQLKQILINTANKMFPEDKP